MLDSAPLKSMLKSGDNKGANTGSCCSARRAATVVAMCVTALTLTAYLLHRSASHDPSEDDLQVPAASPPASAPAGVVAFALLGSGVDCKADDTDLGDAVSADECAVKCEHYTAPEACEFFSYNKDDSCCHREATASYTCPEGLEPGSADFYRLSTDFEAKQWPSVNQTAGAPPDDLVDLMRDAETEMENAQANAVIDMLENAGDALPAGSDGDDSVLVTMSDGAGPDTVVLQMQSTAGGGIEADIEAEAQSEEQSDAETEAEVQGLQSDLESVVAGLAAQVDAQVGDPLAAAATK